MNMPWKQRLDDGIASRSTPHSSSNKNPQQQQQQQQHAHYDEPRASFSAAAPATAARRRDGNRAAAVGGSQPVDPSRRRVSAATGTDQVVVATLTRRRSSMLPAASSNKRVDGSGGGAPTPPALMRPASASSGAGAGSNSNSDSSSAPGSITHPYTAIALSPDRQHAVAACKDTLHLVSIEPQGLVLVKAIAMAPHLASPPSASASTAAGSSSLIGNPGKAEVSFIDAFGFAGSIGRGGGGANAGSGSAVGARHHHHHHHHHHPSSEIVTIVDVAWSRTYEASYSLVAAAGSNGAIVVWSAAALLSLREPATPSGGGGGRGHQSPSSSRHSSIQVVNPEAVLSQHTRAVNKLAWHPKLPLLLSGSQDATVLLWERNRRPAAAGDGTAGIAGSTVAGQKQQPQQHGNDEPQHALNRWFGNPFGRAGGGPTAPASQDVGDGTRPGSGPHPRTSLWWWQMRNRFEPKSEAVRDIQWSPFYDDAAGTLILYNQLVPVRHLAKVNVHSGDAITLDWHPRRQFVVATGGARDRCVKVWNLESYLNLDSPGSGGGIVAASTMSTSNIMNLNSNTVTSTGTEDTNETDRSSLSFTFGQTTLLPAQPSQVFRAPVVSPSMNMHTIGSSSRHGKNSSTTSKAILHVLSISANVTRLRWRPPSGVPVSSPEDPDNVEDLHDAMMAVATAPFKGASAGGAGVLSLWSIHRPYMPLSTVQGHQDGAVADFDWLETPRSPAEAYGPTSVALRSQSAPMEGSKANFAGARASSFDGEDKARFLSAGHRLARGPGSIDVINSALSRESQDLSDEDEGDARIWQHAISVGRDGQCIVQSFVRGERPISRVPPSSFAMANLSPFQKGYGSLQFFSVKQELPSDPRSDFFLTGLRRDSITAAAPGIFREVPPNDSEVFSTPVKSGLGSFQRYPASTPELLFTVVDCGDLARDSTPIEAGGAPPITVAPEVVHLSRFASQYLLCPAYPCATRVDLCLHNAEVAGRMKCSGLAHMWRMIATILQNSGSDSLPDACIFGPDSAEGVGSASLLNVMSFVILPIIRDLLIERAEDGDVQTCVVLCEVLQVIKPDQTVRVPGLELSTIREWYMSYIDLLRDMCLFSHATNLIRNCNDPFIAALNQQSTTIHEACPRCGKPLLDAVTEPVGGAIRRICKSCRSRVALCFLCHEPVKGVYVWCPGCGHGGHLEHALQWFGGLSGRPVREMCPTGCGHRCNTAQQIFSFPRTASLEFSGTAILVDSTGQATPPGALHAPTSSFDLVPSKPTAAVAN